MSHFAKVVNGVVTKVIVAEPDFFSTSGFIDDSPGEWIQTYKDASQRGKYAGIGDTHDSKIDAFLSEQPYPSWVLDSAHQWVSPVGPSPDAGTIDEGKFYKWDEENQEWVKK